MKNKDIRDIGNILNVALRCEVCNVAMCDADGQPYVIPMNFGISGNDIYIHSAPAGKKISILKQNPLVCISFSTDHALRYQSEDVACSYSMKYRSALAYGTIEFITDFNQKIEALNVIMQQYAKRDFTYSAPAVENVCVMKVVVQKWEGRQYGY